MKRVIYDFLNIKYNLELKSVPLRIWTPDWPIPKSTKLEQYKVIVDTSHKTNVSLDRYGLWGEVEKIRDFEKRVYGDKNPNSWGKGKKSGRRFEYKKENEMIWIKILSKSSFFDLNERIFSFDNKYLRMSLKQKEIALWYESKEGQVRFIILPKILDLNEDFFELIGILDGEMTKKISSKGGSSVKISNAEPIIIKKILKEINKSFKIPIALWTASLTINSKGLKQHSDKNLKEYWSKEIGIKPYRFTKTSFQDKYFSKFSDKGIIQVRYSNNLFLRLLIQIMENIRPLILKNKNFCEAYLRGVSAAEGGIGKRNAKLRMFHIGGIQDRDKDFYIKCLEIIGITKIKKYKLRVEICGLNNFKKLESINLLKYHPKRKIAFQKALSELEQNYKKRINQS